MNGKGKKAIWHSGDNLSNGVSMVSPITEKPGSCAMGTQGPGQMPSKTSRDKVSTNRGTFRFR